MSQSPENEASNSDDVQPVPPPPKPSLAYVILGVLIAAMVGFGLYVGSFWMARTSQIAKLKNRNGDFVARRFEAEEGKEETTAQKYWREMFPQPIQNVYWRNQELNRTDMDILLSFTDAEIMIVSTDTVSGIQIGKLLELPKLKRLRVRAGAISIEEIEKWKIPKDFEMLSLANPNWTKTDLEGSAKAAEANKDLEDKFESSNQLGPAAAGG
jgi:hypothetical protein